MNQDNTALLKQNPRIDIKVVKEYERLEKQVPEMFAPKKGADYRLTHPFDNAPLHTQPKR